MAIHAATMQARMGYNVLIVDAGKGLTMTHACAIADPLPEPNHRADRQRNCTTWFQEGSGRHGADDGSASDDEDEQHPAEHQPLGPRFAGNGD